MHKTIYTRQYGVLLELLRSTRQSTGLSQVDLADRLGMNQSDISKCEAGSRRLDIIELKLWSAALGVDFVGLVTQLEQLVEAELPLSRAGVSDK